MELELAGGVNTFFIPTKKFKTVLIEYKFRTDYEPEKATARTLLSNVLVTKTKKYPSQKTMDRQMSWLYGASLSSNSQRYGNQHIVTLRLNVVNDRYIGGDDTLLEETFAFLKEVIFHPHCEGSSFHEATVNREKINLMNYFESIEDNKAGYAVFKLNQLLFKGTKQEYLGSGDAGFLPSITHDSLYQTYNDMLAHDLVDISISGDVEESRIQRILKDTPFNQREDVTSDVFVQRDMTEEMVSQEEVHDVTQANLLFGYQSSVYYMDNHYFAAMVYNGLLGGYPHSKLFQNVREKESLAYSASSTIDFLRGTMVIRTGIECSKKAQVEEIVKKQIEDMQAGHFDEELIVQTKEMLINEYIQTDDRQSGSLSKIYLNRLLAGRDVNDEEWIESVLNVTKEDIISVAKNMTLQAVFFLKGEETHA